MKVCTLVFIPLLRVLGCFGQPSRPFDSSLLSSAVSLNFSTKCGDPASTEFQTFIRHEDSLYVGATNAILKLSSSDLSVSNTFITGPDNDREGCIGPYFCPGGTCLGNLQCTNNYNNFLVPYRDRLLACGTLHAVCDMLTLNNLSNRFPNSLDLKCKRTTLPSPTHVVQISTRSRDQRIAAAIYVNETSEDQDLFYYGRSKQVIMIMQPPSPVYPYFSAFDNSGTYNEQPEVNENSYYLAWTSREYAFLLWSSPREGPRTITLVRYCNKDIVPPIRSLEVENRFANGAATSYTQMKLECSFSGATLNDIISVKFVLDTVYILFLNGENAVLCSSTLNTINQQINSAREHCFTSEDNRGGVVNILGGAGSCSKRSNYNSTWSTCAFPSRFLRFLQAINVVAPLAMTYEASLSFSESEVPTSFIVGRSNNLYSAFIGTSSGSILKVRLGGSSSSVSERIITQENGSPILESMAFDESGETLFAITANSIMKVRAADCENQYQSCFDCLGSLDPYCGWCVLESRCTKRTSCANSDEAGKWIGPDLDSNSCPAVSVIQPSAIAQGVSLKINLTFSGTQLQQTEYTCEFLTSRSDVAYQETILVNFGISTPQCLLTPNADNVVLLTSDHENITLNIKHNGRVLASGSFRVYECANIKALNQYTMCASCVNSEFGCTWCLDSATCTSSTCPNNANANQDRQCPVVTGLERLTADIPVEKQRSFFLATERLQINYDYTCIYSFCRKQNTSSAIVNVSSGIVQCTATAELLTCDQASSDLRVSIRRSEDYIIDVLPSSAVQVRIFNCDVNTNRCGTCIGFREEFMECAWCQSTMTCQPESDSCGSLNTDISECPASVINSVAPTSGPSDGGTEITIRGYSLGSKVQEIERVLVGDVDCTINPTKYVPAIEIVCTTTSWNRTRNGVVQVFTTYSNESADLPDSFLFKDVSARSFAPLVVLDRSVITIRGENLDVGNAASVFVEVERSVRSTCSERTSRSMTCRLPPHGRVGEAQISLSVDGFMHSFTDMAMFAALPNFTSTNKILGFNGGGSIVTLALDSLEGVQTVSLRVEDLPALPCTINVGMPNKPMNSVTCTLPRKPAFRRTKRQANRGESNAEAYLVVNDVHEIPLGPVTYVDDFTLDNFEVLPCDSSSTGSSTSPINRTEDASSELTSTINLKGKNLDATNAPVSDYTVCLKPVDTNVRIECNVSYVDSTSLFCQAPSAVLNDYTNNRLNIEVTVGEVTKEVNDVLFCSGPSILVFAITVPILVVLIIIIVFLLLRHKRKAQKQKKEMQHIIDTMEKLTTNTRDAARNAFTRLQLGYMDNLTNNIAHRITYLPPELYFTQTLFNVSNGHQVLEKSALQQESATTMEAIEDWLGLLRNRDFLMTFVRTLEEQKRFTVQEKGHVASLLTVSLFSDMPYLTSIMFDLLTELIHKHVQKNPKLLLRRSESVVEKMVSHWLSITLYDECIMEKSGEPLFLLSKAIHYLVNSAPCDVIAHKSMNSLNESTLLGQEVSYDTMILRASIEEKDTGISTPLVEVTVVNVDSITQAKAKIIEAVYKDRPYSEWPKPDDLDFELHGSTDSKEGIRLSDIDSMSITEGNYTRINTLKHYNVPSKAHVVLKPARVLSPESDSGGFELFYDRNYSFSNEVPEEASFSQDSKAPLLRGKGRHLYHLVHPKDFEATNGYADVEDGSRGKSSNAVLEEIKQRPFQEFYLTRMVTSKGALQKYVDDVFKSILCPEPIPYPIRYFFQFLDREAARHKINDSEVVHIWKTNSLLLRYWVNVLKNPEFVFDINKTPIVDTCLNVITQAFMDACTTTSRKLGRDSPSNKLLYAEDAEQYKSMVSEFFAKVKDTSWMREEDIDNILRKNSQQYADKFNEHVASKQLYDYLIKYKEHVLEAVKEDHADLAKSVSSLMYKMDGSLDTETTMV